MGHRFAVLPLGHVSTACPWVCLTVAAAARWRKLEGSDPSTYEMIQKIQTLQKRLISKTEEVVEKDLLIQVHRTVQYLCWQWHQQAAFVHVQS